ncbi:shikimate dehydrogenase family protein [Amorphus orientalis]|uniref:Shikimate dehydrogenase n=1 Tax=Amorphus orientalis TaxID=649198 RepID=A0AAE3VNU8_9HYPH|nr:shikimate dehydrogenase [Amorphus orientalis]MDQ0315395.1 shikimate dehydrogenase [Amorphus orientalis]
MDDTTPFAPTAAASIAFMIGAPVAHAHLPGAFNRRLAEEGLDAQLVPLDIPDEGLKPLFAALRGLGNCRGLIVTAPHKRAVLALVDEASPRARSLEAVNLVVRGPDGRLVGDNVDGQGFVLGLTRGGFSVAGARAMIFGCGGAGSAIALALAEAGAASLRLADVAAGQADRLARLVSGATGLEVEVGLPESLAPYDLVINATAVGLDGVSMVHPLDSVRPGALVADVLSRPEPTPWLRAALERGCAIRAGSAMAEGQFDLIADRFGWKVALAR